MNRMICLFVAFVCFTQTAEAVVVVSELKPFPSPGEWTVQTTGAGTGAIVSLVGLGGNLEANALGSSAVKLTTGSDNADKVEVYLRDNFGLASDFLSNYTFEYSYYKEVAGNPSAAPSLKLEILGPNHDNNTNDNFGALIYEPNWNQPLPGSQPPPTGAWQNVSINASTGSGDDASGGWWWTGGFGQGSGSGGPPIKSLLEWKTLFQADADFATAQLVGVGVGVGTYNQDHIGYFDGVSITLTPQGPTLNVVTFPVTYDFELAAPVPEPATLTLLGAGAVGLCVRRRRNSIA